MTRKSKTKNIIIKKNAKRMLIFGFFSVVIIISIVLTIFGVVNQIIDKYKEADELEKKIVALQEKEENLNNEILKLQDSDYLARYAREKYFYSKNGELIIRIPTTDKTE